MHLQIRTKTSRLASTSVVEPASMSLLKSGLTLSTRVLTKAAKWGRGPLYPYPFRALSIVDHEGNDQELVNVFCFDGVIRL